MVARRFIAVRRCAVIACAALAYTALTPAISSAVAPLPTTSYVYFSRAGDPIGVGKTAVLTAPVSTFHLGLIASDHSAVRFDAQHGIDDHWVVLLAAPRGQTLHPGTYLGATLAETRTGIAPGLDVSVAGRKCASATGDFTINSVSFNYSGHITQLDAQFDQICNGPYVPALSGRVRYNAPPPTTFDYISTPGDFIGNGEWYSVVPTAPDQFAFNGAADTAGIRMNWLQIIGGTPTYRDVSVDMRPPMGQAFHLGTYQTRTTHLGPDDAYLDTAINGRGCGTVTYGTLTINYMAYDVNPPGNVAQFDATYVQRCGSPTAPPLYAHMRLNMS